MITSASNPRLRLVRRLRSGSQRRRLGLFAVEGEDLVGAALAAGLEPVDLLRAGEDVEPALLETVSIRPHPARVVAVFRTADLPPAGGEPVGLALWRVSDPGNVGTLARAVDAFGPGFLALSRGCADPTGDKALRASAGAIFRVPLLRFDDAPGPLVGLVPHDGEPLAEFDVDAAVTFVLGAEREGLPEAVLARCEAVATIPQAAGESLNVAMAGTVALWERFRRRR